MTIWLPYKEFPEYFEVSNTGLVKSVTRILVYSDGRSRVSKGKVLKPKIDKDGYLFVGLRINRKRYWRRLHRMVADTFIPNPNNKPQVNHIDCNVSNNHVNNLEWCTAQENIRYAVSKGAKYGSYQSRKINQLTKEGEFVRTWNGISEAVKEGYSEYISLALRKKYSISGGYRWEYA